MIFFEIENFLNPRDLQQVKIGRCIFHLYAFLEIISIFQKLNLCFWFALKSSPLQFVPP